MESMPPTILSSFHGPETELSVKVDFIFVSVLDLV